jgi:hypothetical protein
VQIRPRELRARRQSEFVANPVEEVDLGKPEQAGPLRSGIDADPIAGVEHAAQLTIHTHRDLARPLEHPNPDTFVACGQHEAAIETICGATGVKTSASNPGETIGPPAETVCGRTD